jgi:anti-anti-sigma regulatory factor
MHVIPMRNYFEYNASRRFGLRLANALEKYYEIVLDFSGVQEFDLNILKEVLKLRKKCLERGAVIQIVNAPERFEAIVCVLNFKNDNLIFIK